MKKFYCVRVRALKKEGKACPRRKQQRGKKKRKKRNLRKKNGKALSTSALLVDALATHNSLKGR